MKATTIIIAAVLSLQTTLLFAGNIISSDPAVNDNSAINLVSMAPSTPAEATFEDAAEVDMNSLMPVTPVEATFEDLSFEAPSIVNLAPVTPVSADFEEKLEPAAINITILGPVTPAEADFE